MSNLICLEKFKPGKAWYKDMPVLKVVLDVTAPISIQCVNGVLYTSSPDNWRGLLEINQ